MSGTFPRRSALLLGLLFGCGAKTSADTAVDAASDASGPIDAAACAAAADKLMSAVGGPYCTTMLVLGVADRAVVGWSIACGSRVTTSEEGARKAFDAQIPPYTKAVEYVREGPAGTYDYVFFKSPGDFGGVGVVSFATGSLVFSGSLSWSALGARVYPKTLRPADELPLACAPRTLPDTVVINHGGPIIDPAERAALLDVASRTPLVTALTRSSGIVHTMLVPYPSDGTFGEPDKKSQSQWLVLFDSALLE